SFSSSARTRSPISPVESELPFLESVFRSVEAAVALEAALVRSVGLVFAASIGGFASLFAATRFCAEANGVAAQRVSKKMASRINRSLYLWRLVGLDKGSSSFSLTGNE